MFALTTRYILNEYYNIDVVREMLNISLTGVTYASVLTLFRSVISTIFEWKYGLGIGVLYMDNPLGGGGNAPVGNAPAGNAPADNAPAGNAPAGNAPNWGDPDQPKAGKERGGAMRINDPLNQATNYIPGGDNQPLLSHIQLSLEHQYRIGNSTLSRFMFTPDIEKFILEHLFHTDRALYNKLMAREGQRGIYKDMPKWWDQSNTREFRDKFR